MTDSNGVDRYLAKLEMFGFGYDLTFHIKEMKNTVRYGFAVPPYFDCNRPVKYSRPPLARLVVDHFFDENELKAWAP